MTVLLSEKEIDDAVNALTTWFESQNITHTQGVQVMVRLISIQIIVGTLNSERTRISAKDLIEKVESKFDKLKLSLIADSTWMLMRAIAELEK